MSKRFKLTFSRKKNYLPSSLNSSTVLINGSLITCVILSLASGAIDLAFFSGLSKSLLHVGTVPLPASILYTIISIGFISGKFWCAMKIGMLNELRARLESNGFSWASNLSKALVPWHIAHKLLIAISIITALSLSVNSIGSALKDAERNSTNITISIDELKALKDQKRSDSKDRRSLTRGNLEGVANSKATAEKEADRYWANIESWQAKLAKIYADEEYLALEDDAKKVEYIKKARAPYLKMAPTFVGANIDYISRSELVTRFQQEAKKTEVDKESLKAYEDLTAENEAEIRSTILALENLYKHPTTYDSKGYPIEGKTVSFLDENGEPMDITQVIGALQSLREEWKANSDIGESSQIFMLVSESITSKAGEETSSGSGVAELLMMVFIAIAGIAQEFFIAIYTPKAAIDRKLLSQVSECMRWKSKEEKERFLISVYEDYEGDGIISQTEAERKYEKCVNLMEDNIDSIIARYSKKNKVAEKDAIKETKPKPRGEVKAVKPTEQIVEEVVKHIEQPQIEAPKVEAPKEEGYGPDVENQIHEIEDLLR